MTHVSQSKLAEHLGEIRSRLASCADPILVEDIAVILSPEDYRALRELEDCRDLAAMSAAKAVSEGAIPYAEARGELGL